MVLPVEDGRCFVAEIVRLCQQKSHQDILWYTILTMEITSFDFVNQLCLGHIPYYLSLLEGIRISQSVWNVGHNGEVTTNSQADQTATLTKDSPRCSHSSLVRSSCIHCCIRHKCCKYIYIYTGNNIGVYLSDYRIIL